MKIDCSYCVDIKIDCSYCVDMKIDCSYCVYKKNRLLLLCRYKNTSVYYVPLVAEESPMGSSHFLRKKRDDEMVRQLQVFRVKFPKKNLIPGLPKVIFNDEKKPGDGAASRKVAPTMKTMGTNHSNHISYCNHCNHSNQPWQP